MDFREVSDNADNDIRIGLGDTGELGTRGGALAYTSSFSRGEGTVESVIALDTEEPWTLTHIYNVMLHEIGHAIGLDHSQVQGAVMSPTYDMRGTTTRLRLHQDDIAGIKAIFPPRDRNSLPTTDTIFHLGDLTALPAPSSTAEVVEPNRTDYFVFNLTASRRVRFELRNLTADADLYLQSQTGTELARSIRGGTAVDVIDRTLGAGTYHLLVRTYMDDVVNYQLHASTPPPDGRTPQTAHDLGDLTSLASARTFSDTVNRETNDDDYRRFTLTARRTMRFELSGLSADADLSLEDSSGELIVRSARYGTADDAIVRTLDAGTYYVRVSAHAAGTIDYQFRLSQQSSLPSPPAGGQTRQTAHDLGDLTSLASARTFSDTVNRDTNDDDYRRFTLTTWRTMRFELSGLSADADLYLENSTGAVFAFSVRPGTADDTIVRTLGAGTYYVRVDAFAAGAIDYQLRLSQERSPPSPPAEGGTRQTAHDLGDLTSLASPRTFSDTVNRETNDDDYRRFTLTASRTMRFELRGLSADADLYLESSTGTVLARSVRGGRSDDTIVRTLGAGTYYVRVDAYAAGTIGYQLRVSQEAGSLPAEGETRQTAHDLGDLTSLASPRTFSDTVNRDTNDKDYRRFTLTASRTMRFELSNLTADADLYLESAAGTELARSRLSGTADDTVSHTLGAGTYYVRVGAYASGTIGYQLRVSQEAGSLPAEGGTRQTAHDLGDLTSLASPRTFSDTVNRETNDDDYRRFTLTASRTMHFELSNLSADADLYLESSTGTVLARSARGRTAVDRIERELGAGTYYIRVDAYAAGTIGYRLSVSQQSISPIAEPAAEGTTRQTAHDLGDLTSLTSPRTFSDTVNRDTNDKDYRRFTLTASRTMRFELSNLSADADLYLENSFGGVIVRSARYETADDTIVRTLAAGTYYVRVDAYAAGTIDYRLSLSQQSEPPGPPAEGTTRETAHDLGDLTSLASARTFSGTVNRNENDDAYRRFTLTARRTMRFELSNLSADAHLYLESSTGTVLAQSANGGTTDDTIVRALDAGTYYVRVDAVEGRTIDYQLRVSQQSGDGRTRQTAHDLGDLTSLTSPRTFSDTVNRETNDDDYRRFTLTASRTMRFELSNLSADADLYLESSTGTELARSRRGGSTDDAIERTLGAGTYYVRVDAFAAGTIDYRLRVRSSPPPPPPAAGTTRQTAHNLGDLTSLTSARTFSDTVNRDTNDDDYRRFTLTARRTMRFELSNLSADADLFLESSTGTVLARSVRNGTSDDTIMHTLDAGTYYVRVDAIVSGTIDYRLRVSQQSSTDGRTRQTAHDLGDLTSLASARTFSDTVTHGTNGHDYRRFTLTARRTMRFELSNLSADADLYLESSTGTELARSDRGSTADDTIVHTLDAGTYYVHVESAADGTIEYRLRLSQGASSGNRAAAAPEPLAASSQRLWRDRDMSIGRSLRTNEEGRLREASGILAA